MADDKAENNDAAGSRPRVYLAGPDVFLADPLVQAAAKKAICREFGFDGVFPLDSEIEILPGTSPAEAARKIALGNEELMRSCDFLVANCAPFRGVSMDAGTAYEIGFMRALGKPVFGYTNVVGDYRQRTEAYIARGGDRDAPDIEDFGLAENLMIAVALSESGIEMVQRQVARGDELTDLGGFRACLERAASVLGVASGSR